VLGRVVWSDEEDVEEKKIESQWRRKCKRILIQ
jgi:hypothetical protein